MVSGAAIKSSSSLKGIWLPISMFALWTGNPVEQGDDLSGTAIKRWRKALAYGLLGGIAVLNSNWLGARAEERAMFPEYHESYGPGGETFAPSTFASHTPTSLLEELGTEFFNIYPAVGSQLGTQFGTGKFERTANGVQYEESPGLTISGKTLALGVLESLTSAGVATISWAGRAL